jgi:hypothetical protein
MTIASCANTHALTHSQAASNPKPNMAPSAAAHDYLAANSDADDKPFGKLVSMFAQKNETPPSI